MRSGKSMKGPSSSDPDQGSKKNYEEIRVRWNLGFFFASNPMKDKMPKGEYDMTLQKTIGKMKGTHMRHTVVALALMVGIAGGAFADVSQKPASPGPVLDNMQVVAISATSTVRNGIDVDQEVVVNGKALGFQVGNKPILSMDQELLLPLGQIMKSMGHQVSWNPKTYTVSVVTDSGTFIYKVQKQRFIKEKTFYQGMHEAELIGDNGDAYRIMIRNGSILAPVRLFESMRGSVVIPDGNNRLIMDSKRHAPEGASTLGIVEEIVQGKDGIQILVGGSAYGKLGHDRISLAVPTGVEVKLSGGKAMKASEIKVGDQVLVTYGPAVTKSLPPIGQAISIEVIREEGIFEGKVYEIMKADPKDGITRMRVIGTNDYVISIDAKTMIQSADGKKMQLSDIKEGSILKVYTAPYAAMSYPAQTGAYRIFITPTK